MAKPIYTHPELAAHLRNLFARGTPYGWGGLQHHMEKAVEKTIDEMFENKEVIFKNNLIQLPTPQTKPANPKKPKRHEGG